MFLSLQSGFIFPAHYESSSWANGLLDKLARPKYDSFNFPTRYGSCRTGLFFPIRERFSFSSPLLVQQLDQWPDGHACSSPWERFTSPARYGSNSWTNGLLDMLILPNRSGFSSSPQWVQQLDQWRPMACWTSLFFPIWEHFNSPAHYGSSNWTNGLLDKLALPNKGAP